MYMLIWLYFLLAVFNCINAETCYYTDSFLSISYKTCLFGCCSYTYSPCCSLFANTKYVYYVIGGSVGGVIFLTCLICICCAVCNNKSTTRVHTTGQPQQSIAVVSAAQQPGPSYGYPYNGPPPNAGYPYGGYPAPGYHPNQPPQSYALPGQVNDAPPKYQTNSEEGKPGQKEAGQHPPPNTGQHPRPNTSEQT